MPNERHKKISEHGSCEKHESCQISPFPPCWCFWIVWMQNAVPFSHTDGCSHPWQRNECLARHMCVCAYLQGAQVRNKISSWLDPSERPGNYLFLLFVRTFTTWPSTMLVVCWGPPVASSLAGMHRRRRAFCNFDALECRASWAPAGMCSVPPSLVIMNRRY